VVARSGSGASTSRSSVIPRGLEPLLRATNNLALVPSLVGFPVTAEIGVVASGLSTLAPPTLLAVLIVILSSTGTGLLIELAASRVMTTKVGVSRLARVLGWVAARSVAEM
jgi:hypothetical protein